MKIAIPVYEKDMGTNVCVSFGRTPYFLNYDIETKESIFIYNNTAARFGTKTVICINKFDTNIENTEKI